MKIDSEEGEVTAKNTELKLYQRAENWLLEKEKRERERGIHNHIYPN